MSQKSDILLLGATGFTGRLITRYLPPIPNAHPSPSHSLVQELNLNQSIILVDVDVTNPEQVERAVKSTKVVINTVGPYWRWGTPVVKACTESGVHYVDLTGETVWIKKLILEYDYFASKTGAVIVPSCGFDSVPADISAYLGNKTLKAHDPSLNPASSVTAYNIKGGISGGTLSTAIMMLSGEVPREKAKEQIIEYSLSPVIGVKPPKPQFVYTLPIPGARPLIGGFFFMQPVNKHLVQRTWGLLELEAKNKSLTNSSSKSSSQLPRYGPEFCYDEFVVLPSRLIAILMRVFLMIRWVVSRLMPQSGEGPQMSKGDPGYLLTAIMVSESALALALDGTDKLTEFARRGGVLTPVTAFGDRLVERLGKTGRFEFASSVVGEKDKDL
ncbi:Saccharopine dehydrogenase-domain-containing protein [Cyathus striatus]|nr:Saccharopine dehydrogenase-domain-containing protein [Cyathus striatus]